MFTMLILKKLQNYNNIKLAIINVDFCYWNIRLIMLLNSLSNSYCIHCMNNQEMIKVIVGTF